MSSGSKAKDSPKPSEQSKQTGVGDDLTKKLDTNALEEDDEFEEFPVEEWASRELADDEADDVNVWEDNWDDDAVEDDFSKQLRTELEKHGVSNKGGKGASVTEKPR